MKEELLRAVVGVPIEFLEFPNTAICDVAALSRFEYFGLSRGGGEASINHKNIGHIDPLARSRRDHL